MITMLVSNAISSVFAKQERTKLSDGTSVYKTAPTFAELDKAIQQADDFAKIDLALKGDCAVCVAENGATVPGSPEFTAVHNGFRYQFPSDRDLQVFLRNPERYASARIVRED